MPGLIRGQPRSSAFPAGMFWEQTSLNDYRELCCLKHSALITSLNRRFRTTKFCVLTYFFSLFYEEICFALLCCSGYTSSFCGWTKVKNYSTRTPAKCWQALSWSGWLKVAGCINSSINCSYLGQKSFDNGNMIRDVAWKWSRPKAFCSIYVMMWLLTNLTFICPPKRVMSL